jgi:cytochrome c5
MRGLVMRAVMVCVVGSLAACRQAPPPPADSTTGAGGGHGLNQQDELLLAAANIALPPPDVKPADLPEPNSKGAQLMAQYCAQCHNLPTPAMHSATDWPSIARRMWLRMEWLPPTLGVKVPTMAERFATLDYLTANALKVSAANLPPGPGRETFQLVCSRCHALPDPRVHSPADWPTVFARMERNMERMKVAPLARSQTSDILLYLQSTGRQ